MTLSSHIEQVKHYSAVKRRLWSVPERPAKLAPARAVARKVYADPIGPQKAVARQAYAREIGPGMGMVFVMPTTPMRAKRIMQEICKLYGVRMIDLVSQRRDALTCRARQHCYWTMRHETTWSLPRIGKFFGNRDHTSILHGIRRHEARIAAGEVMP